MPSVPAFPQELYDLIIEMAKDDRPTLCDLCLVSRAFCFTAQRCLYTRVALGGVKIEGKGRNRWSLNNIANNTFFSTLLQAQHLALHVRELYFRPDVGFGGANPWKLFRQALHEMINLKRLQLTLMTSDQTSSHILEALGNHPFQLEVFSWVDYRFKIAANESEALISFLLSQPRLQALGIMTKSIRVNLPEKSCPKLSTFIGTFAHALGVLRGRCPITSFIWTAPLDARPRSYTTNLLRASFTNLRVLVLRDHIPAELDRCTNLMNCFQSLEALHVYITPNDIYKPGLVCLLAGATRCLSNLPALSKLRMVALTGIILCEWQRLLSEHRSFATVQTFIMRFFDTHPNLERFYTNEARTSAIYQRWKRAEEYPTDVKRDDFEEFYQVLGFDSSLIGGRAACGRAVGV